jgi:8-oxo-dGTP pyrophosphatase MutT (NUDIX family)
MLPVTEDMLIDAVDDHDVPVGVIQRSEVFVKRQNFRVIHNLVFNSRGDLLVQRLASTRVRHPGYWGSSVAGYVFAGESYEAAASRRLAEELGVRLPLTFLGKTVMDDEGCQKFISIYRSFNNGPFDYDHGHIERIEFLPLRVIGELQALGSRKFTPTFLRVMEFYENRM